ncbi:rho GTPase-activating protein 33-like [Equus quagga]|uniref:rho GTPase-activating protein 33-like n=1 Tax=Equus quagga TaxID=89248 RepID=UPI001EE3186E|nr:rho GTPase-activating protein 33-like [Equus quagga]
MVMRGGGERAGSSPGWVTAAFSVSTLFPLLGALPLRSPPPALPESIPARGRGERFSAEQTKPTAAMRGEPGSARCGGQDGVPGWRVGPPGKRRGPLILKRQAIPPHPLPPPSLGDLRGTDWEFQVIARLSDAPYCQYSRGTSMPFQGGPMGPAATLANSPTLENLRQHQAAWAPGTPSLPQQLPPCARLSHFCTPISRVPVAEGENLSAPREKPCGDLLEPLHGHR